MPLFQRKDKPRADAPADKPPRCPVVRTCPNCRCPVENPYALTCPRCRTDLPPMPDCGQCGANCHP